jgi:hypothetical protein
MLQFCFELILFKIMENNMSIIDGNLRNSLGHTILQELQQAANVARDSIPRTLTINMVGMIIIELSTIATGLGLIANDLGHITDDNSKTKIVFSAIIGTTLGSLITTVGLAATKRFFETVQCADDIARGKRSDIPPSVYSTMKFLNEE